MNGMYTWFFSAIIISGWHVKSQIRRSLLVSKYIVFWLKKRVWCLGSFLHIYCPLFSIKCSIKSEPNGGFLLIFQAQNIAKTLIVLFFKIEQAFKTILEKRYDSMETFITCAKCKQWKKLSKVFISFSQKYILKHLLRNHFSQLLLVCFKLF